MSDGAEVTMPISPRVVAGLLGFVPGLLACNPFTVEEPVEWVLRPGTVEFYNEPVVFELPDEAAIGADVTITVRTYGGGCNALGPTHVVIASDLVTLSPLDSAVAPNENIVCTEELRLFDHTVTLSFDTAREFTVRVIGRKEPGDTETVLERTLTVQ